MIFSMVANRLSVKPLSKLAGCSWVAKRAFVDNLAEVTDDQCYRAMDFLLEALPELQESVFFSVANLMNLEVDLLFFDTSSTYFETERLEDELAGDEEDDGDSETEEEVDEPLEEAGVRRFSSHSKDHRRDLPQVVLGLAVTREGIPVRMWTFPGTTSDQDIIKKVKDDLGAWGLHRVIWCLDRGFSPESSVGGCPLMTACQICLVFQAVLDWRREEERRVSGEAVPDLLRVALDGTSARMKD